MKKTLLSIGIAIGSISMLFAQEPYPCHTDEITKEYVSSLSEQERALYEQEKAAFELETQQFIANNPQLLTTSDAETRAIKYTIPIVFHILHDGGDENISNEQIENCVQHMNDDFQKLNSEWPNVVADFLPIVADCQIEFKLAKIDPYGNCTNGITRTKTSVTFDNSPSLQGGTNRINAVKAEHGNWPGHKYLNVYVAADIGGAAGYTMYPDVNTRTSMNNGIHVLHNYVGSIGTAGSNGAHTLTHEVGHWLNLPHLWGNSNEPGLESNCNIDDGVDDTPNTKGWTSCTLNGRSCDGTLDNVENFMEYSYCSKMFTNGQKARMHAALDNPSGRKDLWAPANLTATGVNQPEVLCKAEFSAQYREVCQGQQIEFRDMSHSGVTSRQWKFEGGSPATSTQENPIVSFNQPGTYKVELTVSDGNTTLTKVEEAYIRVLDEGLTLPFSEGFENATNIDETEWSLASSSSDYKFQITNEASYSGDHSLKLNNFGKPKGRKSSITSMPIDLSTVTNSDKVTLSFRYAYRKRSASNDEWLRVFLTDDCGESWVQRRTIKGNSLGSETSGNTWTPSSNDDWTTVHVVNITSQFWIENFRFKIEFESDGGNNIFLDNINIYHGGPENEGDLGIDENELIQNFMVYPNPVDNLANISFSVENSQSVNVSLVNAVGQEILSNEIYATNGNNLVMLNTESVQAGIYFVKVNVGGAQQVKRIVIK